MCTACVYFIERGGEVVFRAIMGVDGAGIVSWLCGGCVMVRSEGSLRESEQPRTLHSALVVHQSS